jgi:serine/threonine protein kinase
MQELSGTSIGRYRLRHRIAEGGMSEVYLAQDRKTAQEVAIKLVRANDDYYTRFQREVRAIDGLHHEHILPALDYGEYESWLYLVTPYVAQGTLDAYLAAGPLSCEEASKILQQLADALQFAHEHGIIHRDIKPSNVLLAEGMHVYLADFGLVKSGKEQQSLTQTGFMVGTPAYIAPEMMDGSVTPACDIYALGVLLYQMLTGRLPFQADTPVAVVWKHVYEKPAPPSTLNPTLSPAIDDVILRSLEKDPDKRFGTPRELAVAYQKALHDPVDSDPHAITEPLTMHQMAAAMMPATIATVQKKKKKVTLLTAGLAAGLCTTVLLFGIFTYGLQHQSSYSSTTPDRPVPTSTSPHRVSTPSTSANREQTQDRDDDSQGQGRQGQVQPSQSASTNSPAARPAPSIAKPAPPKPGNGNGPGKKNKDK